MNVINYLGRISHRVTAISIHHLCRCFKFLILQFKQVTDVELALMVSCDLHLRTASLRVTKCSINDWSWLWEHTYPNEYILGQNEVLPAQEA